MTTDSILYKKQIGSLQQESGKEINNVDTVTAMTIIARNESLRLNIRIVNFFQDIILEILPKTLIAYLHFALQS